MDDEKVKVKIKVKEKRIMQHKGSVRLETGRLVLRRFAKGDADAIFRNWASDPDVTKFLTWPVHESVEASRRILDDWLLGYDKPDFYQWAIEVKSACEVIGSIGAVALDDQIRKLDVGYCIGKGWWRMGYTSEALARLVQFFFEDVGVNRIEAYHDPRNPNSGKVMQKAGLLYEGTLRESYMCNQGVCDAAHYAILAKDYFSSGR